MQAFVRHITRSMVAGMVALLPVAGVVIGVIYAERSVAQSGLADQPYYFPGMGLLAAAVVLYAIGLFVTTFLGRWFWFRADALLDRMPLLGRLYQTFKQILGYGEGPDALFKRVVMVPSRESGGFELGLVTAEADASGMLSVFVPTAPNPMMGRLVKIEPQCAQGVDCSVSDALKTLVSLGSVNPTPPDKTAC